jgi:hypothetical protein
MLYLSLFLFLFPQFHRVVLLQAHSTSEFVYDHACFCVYVYLWIYLPHVRENMWPLSFSAWITSLNVMSSNCIHLPSNHVIIPYGWVKLHCIYVYIHIFLIHLSVVGCLGWFYSLATVNWAAINIGVQVSLLYPDLYSFGWMLWSLLCWKTF